MKLKVVKKSGQADVQIKGLTKIGGSYYYRPPQIDGVRPPRIALKTKIYEVAVTLALETRAKIRPEFVAGTLAAEIKKWCEQRKDRKINEFSKWTLKSRAYTLQSFQRFLGNDKKVIAITKADIESWRNSLKASGKSSSTINTYMAQVKVFFRWLETARGLAVSPMKEVEIPKQRNTRADKFCTKIERERLLTVARQSKDIELMLMLGFFCGLRFNEIIEARVDWLRLWEGGGELVVSPHDSFKTKNGHSRRIPLNDRMLNYLKELQFEGVYLVRDDIRGKHKNYRYNPRHLFERFCKEADLEWMGWHTLRHTFATLLVIGGCPIATVAQWLGDGINVTFRHYIGYSPQKDHINASL